jgi:hypothetical protein
MGADYFLFSVARYGHIGRAGRADLSSLTQTAIKFGPHLRHHGQTVKNTPDRWERFFLAAIILGFRVWMADVRLRRAVGDALTPFLGNLLLHLE